MALKDGKPYLSFAKQAGDEQDQLLLQFFLNMAEFDMTVQEACEAPSFKTLQMYSSFGKHERINGGLTLNEATPSWTRKDLSRMGYKIINYQERTSILSMPFISIGNMVVSGVDLVIMARIMV
jgi:gamma-glutamyltranspeptidase/glutathione hydrolase